MNKQLIDKYISYTAYVYISLPALLFLAGWVRWQISIPVIIALVYCFFLAIRQEAMRKNEAPVFEFKRKKIFYLIAFIAFWLFMSGIAGYTYQNEDHQYRNAIFSDLVAHSWPVTYHIGDNAIVENLRNKETMMAYYIGYWLPAAVVGKVLGIMAGKFFLYLWTLLGVCLILYFTFKYLKKITFPLLLMILFFGNLSVIAELKYHSLKDVLTYDYLLWANGLSLSESIHSGVYWVFNQYIIPVLVLTLILNKIPARNLVFIYIFAFFQGPFAFLGIAPFLLLIILKDCATGSDGFFHSISKYFSIQNIFAAVVLLPILYFFMSGNSAAQHIAIVHVKLRIAVLFLFVAFGLISLLLFPKYRAEPLFYLSVVLLSVIPFIQIGYGADFGSRVSTPAVYILMVLTMRFLLEDGFGRLKPIVLCYVCLSATASVLSFSRSVVFTIWNVTDHTALSEFLYERANIYHYQKIIGKKPHEDPDKNFLIQNDLKTLDNPANFAMGNFMSLKGSSVFYKYLAKREQ